MPFRRLGKLTYGELEELLSRLRRQDASVLLGPAIGEDAALIDLGDKVLVVHADPITGAVSNIGWLSVHVSANDVATRGVQPRWLVTVVLLPEGAGQDVLWDIAGQLRKAADEIGATIVGGHTEFTPGLDRPILVTTAMGVGGKGEVLATSRARPGDALILTKGAGIEGTAILATELYDELSRKVDREVLERAKSFIYEVSVVKDALTAVRAGGVHAMHDPTEGGVLGGLQEMAIAANAGLVVEEEKIPVREETKAVCRALGVDPLRLISSGSLLIAVEGSRARDVVDALSREGIPAAVIGRLTEGSERILVKRGGEIVDLNEPVVDELWRILGER
ncbi:AIR synthase family protein [Thermofilum pendens]|uniref:AIR synthase related protein domain protein n=1 Tax=Thermofilum pendens (strain DSM 2475 / Hrk 5) TaxID=368408 RepID=A1S0T2_THEPD|nr:AIR synthase family protein [Thermofilum pendens]ABL79062.1 AIR synthase related protein domain protein [Thermofilum pendens Hrk 5]